MGDNFDLLFGYNDYIQTFSKEAVDLLQKLSETLEIHYFEGNHDFCLQTLFPKIRVYTREEQPVMFRWQEKRVALAHGDRYVTGFGYELYCRILRNKYTLTLLKPFEKSIIDSRMKKLSQKNICRTLDGFEKKVEEILSYYPDTDLVIEGHFHQAKRVGRYCSLPSLACQGELAVAREGKVVFERVERL